MYIVAGAFTFVTEVGVEKAAQTLALSLQDDPLFVYLLPDQKERPLRLLLFFTAHVRFAHLGEVDHPHLAVPNWYLMALGVRPDSQRQGIGGALLQPILERVAADGLPCYLDTSWPDNLVFYRKQGFTTLVESVLPGTNLHFWTLVKRP